MFTERQLKDAYSKVTSGADYPKYAQDLKQLGVEKYDFVVESGKNVFYGKNDFSVTTEPKYENLTVADDSSEEKLQYSIAIHQQGETAFPTFCKQAAEAGVAKWTSDLEKMNCNYFDKKGSLMISEPIPTGNYD